MQGVSYRGGEVEIPRGDGMITGSDYVTPGEVRLTLVVDVTHIRDGQQARAELRKRIGGFTSMWNHPRHRQTPGKVSELRLGEIGIVEGRPRGVEWSLDEYAPGFARGTAVFARTNSELLTVTGDAAGWQEHEIGLIPAQTGGLLAPLAAPLSTAKTSSRARPFEIDSATPVHPLFKLTGELHSGAVIELVGGWRLTLAVGLNYDDTAVIDTRPGRCYTTLNDSPVNILAPTSARLSTVTIPPGVNELVLRGTSPAGDAKLLTRWRNTTDGEL